MWICSKKMAFLRKNVIFESRTFDFQDILHFNDAYRPHNLPGVPENVPIVFSNLKLTWN